MRMWNIWRMTNGHPLSGGYPIPDRPNIFKQCSIHTWFFLNHVVFWGIGYYFVKPAFSYLSLCLDIYISSTFRFTIFIAKGIENDTTDYLVLCPWIKMTILIFGLEEQKPKRGIILESRTNASKCLNLHVELSGFGGFHQHHQHCHCHMMIIFITITLVTVPLALLFLLCEFQTHVSLSSWTPSTIPVDRSGGANIGNWATSPSRKSRGFQFWKLFQNIFENIGWGVFCKVQSIPLPAKDWTGI